MPAVFEVVKAELQALPALSARRRSFGRWCFDSIGPAELREGVEARLAGGAELRVLSSSIQGQFAARDWLPRLLAAQQLSLPQGELLLRLMGRESVSGERAESVALRMAARHGLRVVCVSGDAVVPWALRLRREHRGLNLVAALDAGGDLRDRHGCRRLADRVRGSEPGLLLLRVQSAGMAALALGDAEQLGTACVFSSITL